MKNPKLDELVLQLENYIECWKQFNRYLSLARAKKFTAEDEEQFLETKSIMTQELELITAQIPVKSPTREEVLDLIASIPSLRYLGEAQDDSLRVCENKWHKIYIGWQSILGQLKVEQRELGTQSRMGSFFGAKKK